MNWRTHAAVGANAVWIASAAGQVDQSILALLPAAVLGGLLPDIDAASAKIHYAGGGVLGGFQGLFFGKYFQHRGLMHSLFVALVFFILALIFFREQYPLLPYVFAAAYVSHSIVDAFNYKGVGFLFPFNTRLYHLLPKFLRTQVNGPVDNLLFMVAMFGVAMFFLVNANAFLSFSGL